MNESDVSATRCLQRIRAGDAAAADELLPLVYRELHEIAEHLMQRERAGHTLQPTALVHEAWLRLGVARGEGAAECRAEFLRVAARAMRNVLIDHARARRAHKRGRRSELAPEVIDQLVGAFEERKLDLLALHESLERLARIDVSLAGLVELRFFAGLTVGEIARLEGVSVSKLEASWRLARAWLRRELGSPDEGDA
jgi:RNA polymerase sigma factor (TIGR02999 family)